MFETGSLSEIAEIISGYAFKSAWFGNGSDKVIRISDIQNNQINSDKAVTFDSRANPVPEQFRIQEGDILMALSGATTGKIGVANKKDQGTYLNQRVAIIRGKSLINSKYIKYVLSGEKLNTLLLLAGGAAQPNLSPKDLSAMQIPLPPLEEQKRISAILDKADALRRKRQKAIGLTDQLLRSVFLDMFGDPVTNPKGWKKEQFENLGIWASGGTPSRRHKEYFLGDIDWYSAGELNTRYVKTSIEKITESAIKESAAKVFKSGSILLGMYDTAAFKLSILQKDSASNQACANLEPNGSLSVEWFYTYISIAKEHYLRLRRGVRQKNLNLGMIKSLNYHCRQ